MIKRICAVFISAVMIIAFTAVCTSAADGYIRGDVNGNGKVDINDATSIQRKLAGLNVGSFNEAAADVDGDGLKVNDVTAIQSFLAGRKNTYNIGEIISQDFSYDEYELPFVPS